MSRDPGLYLQDIRDCANKTLTYAQGMTQEEFEASGMAYDAIIRNLEIIGEASKHIPGEMREVTPEIPWRMICGFRDHLAHGYFGLDNDTVWEVVTSELPALLTAVERLLGQLPGHP